MEFLCEKDALRVSTTGGAVRGYRHNGLDIFKGIPYAKARRFHAPEPAQWEGTFDATSYGCVCPLLRLGRPGRRAAGARTATGSRTRTART